MDLFPFGSKLWHNVHTFAKPLIRRFVNFIWSSYYKEAFEKKQKEGWINEEIEIFYKLLTKELFPRQGVLWSRKDHEHRGRPVDGNEKLWNQIAENLCVFLDEDSYYLLRFLFLIELIHLHYPEFKIAMHKTRAYWDQEKWTAFREGLLDEVEKQKLINDGYAIEEGPKDETKGP